jgi:hypothetical protein
MKTIAACLTAFLVLTLAAATMAGEIDFEDGSRYVGDVVNGVAHGRGKRVWPDGRRYDGDWHYGDRQGQGVFTWPGGATYRGRWHEDRWHGEGTYTKPDGATISGDWKNGNLWNGEQINADGNRQNWVNGYVQ